MQGKIFKGIGGFYYVMTDSGVVECRACGRFRKEHIIPMIGDEVVLDVKNGKGYINEIMPRRTKLIRPAVANIDTIVIVVAAKSPDPNTAVIDKMLINAEINGITPIICLNKSDLADPAELVKLYSGIGYKTVVVSAEENCGIEELHALIDGKVAAFAGVSGVGKSSLLTLITGSELETGEVSQKISRGRHTTRHVELFALNKGFVLDTPGFSSVEPEITAELDIAGLFPEIKRLTGQCRFRGCKHIGEPDCAVKEAVNAGDIPQSRYNIYTELCEIQRSIPEWK